jgi:membrane-associated phospholipid phosphatase
MNAFDADLIVWMSRVAFHSHLVTRAIVVIADMYIFKGVVLIALLWWIWFRAPRTTGAVGGAEKQRDRERVVVAIISGLVALAAGRLLAHYLPFRMRPIYEPAFQSLFPVSGVQEPVLRTWSAFPSDHAMLWCAIATGIFLVSRPAGTYAMLHAIVLISLPRVYLGLHHPSDVLAGIVLGVGIACLMNAEAIRTRVAAPVLSLAQRHAGVFYGLAFILSFELATQFDELRQLAQGMTHVVSRGV